MINLQLDFFLSPEAKIVLGAEKRGPTLVVLMLLQIKMTCQIGNNNNYGSQSDKSISG